MPVVTAAVLLEGAAKALQIIEIVSGYLKLAAEIGGDVGPFITYIQRISAAKNVTQADVNELHSMSKPYLDMLNDTSRDK